MMSNMLISKKCVDLVKSFEGFISTIYKDPVGIPTLGYGMTGALIAGLTFITESQAATLLESLLNNKYATPIKADLDSKKVVLNQNQFDALVSFSYNCGLGGLFGSTLYKNIVKGIRDRATITANFQAWSKGNGEIIAGLLRRRNAECNLFFNTSFATPIAPIAISKVDISIRNFQKNLNILGFVGKDKLKLVENGLTNANSIFSVQTCQKVLGLPTSGKFDLITMNAINSILAKPIMKLGSKGIGVGYLQFRLGLKIDNILGSDTQSHLRSFQRINKIKDDGIVGEGTWGKLFK